MEQFIALKRRRILTVYWKVYAYFDTSGTNVSVVPIGCEKSITDRVSLFASDTDINKPGVSET